MSSVKRPSKDTPVRAPARRDDYEEVEPATPITDCTLPEDQVDRRPSATMVMLRQEKLTRLGSSPEVKFFSTTASTGVASQNTWSNYDQLSNIALGTDQNQRIGRVIRLKKIRVVINVDQAAHDTVFGHCLLMRVDPTISGSDLWVTNGSARVALLEPNPIAAKPLYHFVVKTAMQYAGAAAGTTPSYSSFVHTIEHDFGRGHIVRYDAGGAVLGPTPVPWYCVDETGLTFSVAYQLWFTDE